MSTQHSYSTITAQSQHSHSTVTISTIKARFAGARHRFASADQHTANRNTTTSTSCAGWGRMRVKLKSGPKWSENGPKIVRHDVEVAVLVPAARSTKPSMSEVKTVPYDPASSAPRTPSSLCWWNDPSAWAVTVAPVRARGQHNGGAPQPQNQPKKDKEKKTTPKKNKGEKAL